MAVVKSFKAIGFGKCIENFSGDESGSKWHVSAGQTFGQCNDIRSNPFLLTGEKGSGTAEAGHDLVENQPDAVLFASACDMREKSGWVHPHARGSLDARLHDH